MIAINVQNYRLPHLQLVSVGRWEYVRQTGLLSYMREHKLRSAPSARTAAASALVGVGVTPRSSLLFRSLIDTRKHANLGQARPKNHVTFIGPDSRLLQK